MNAQKKEGTNFRIIYVQDDSLSFVKVVRIFNQTFWNQHANIDFKENEVLHL